MIKDTIELGEGVQATFQDGILTLKGPKGEVSRPIRDPTLEVGVQEGSVELKSQRATKREKKLLFTYRAHIRNMARGAREGHIYRLKVCASHFPMNVAVSGDVLTIKNFVGEKHPRTLKLKAGADVKVDGDIITIESSDKEVAGTIASDIEKLTRRAGFDPRIFQDGIYIIEKDGEAI